MKAFEFAYIYQGRYLEYKRKGNFSNHEFAFMHNGFMFESNIIFIGHS